VSPASSRAEPLTRDDFVDAALRVTKRAGLDGLTMRAVAAELGVSPMAIYYHLRDKDELVTLAVEAVLSRIDPLDLGPDGWEAALRRYLLSAWQELTGYPGVGAYLIGTPTMGTTPQRTAQQVRFFEDAGFPPRAAGLAWAFALTYLHGRLSVDARLRGKAARGSAFTGLHRRDYVEFGVDSVIAGLRAMLPRHPDGDASPA